MPKRTLKLIVLIAIFLMPFTRVHASLLDTGSPFFTQDHPLGRNPARAAYLREHNRFHVSYTVATELSYSDNFIKSDRAIYELSSKVPDIYTNMYISGASPLFSKNADAYIGIVLAQNEFDRQLNSKNWTPLTTIETQYVEYDKGFSISSPLFGAPIYAGIEVIQKEGLYTEATSGGPLKITSIQEYPYDMVTLGLLWKITNGWTVGLSQTMYQETFSQRDYRDYALGSSLWQSETFTNYKPPITGASLLFRMSPDTEIGIGMEMVQQGLMWDYATEENMLETTPYSRYSFGVESRPLGFLAWRIFTGYARNKDARTSYYDWELFKDKVALVPQDTDDLTLYNEEDVGGELEFIIRDTFSIILGGNKKNYLFMGTNPPYGYSAIVCDSRVYAGIAIGSFDLPVIDRTPAPAPVSSDVEAAEVSTIDLKEELSISSPIVAAGTDVRVSIKEGPKRIKSGVLSYKAKKQEYSTLLQKKDGQWKALLPVSPLLTPGNYTFALQKQYMDKTSERITFNVTVIPATAQ